LVSLYHSGFFFFKEAITSGEQHGAQTLDVGPNLDHEGTLRFRVGARVPPAGLTA